MKRRKKAVFPTYTNPATVARPAWVPTCKTCGKCKRTAYRKVEPESPGLHLLACANCGYTTTTVVQMSTRKSATRKGGAA